MTTGYMNDTTRTGDGDQDYALWSLFTNARYTTFRAREKELQRYQLTPEQAHILYVIQVLNKRATLAEISRAIHREPCTVSATVERMQRSGLLKKVPHPQNKNWIRVKLTKKGEAAYELTVKRGPIHRIFKSLDEGQSDQFQQILEKILNKARAELGLDRDNLPSSN
jgi:MarR family transcriptional regulator, organic hydroperoxide resistance regulator